MPHPIKITKKHHKRFNNPFPSRPKSLALTPGNLFSSTQTLPNPHQNFPIGHDFQLHHTHQKGGVISISHNSRPRRSIWSTVPGQAFVSAACARTEAEESRGSFVIKDKDVLCICNHQFIEEIQVLDQPQVDFSSGSLAFDPKATILDQFKGTHFPALVISGWIFSRKKLLKSIIGKSAESETKKLKFRKAKKLFISARYSVLFYQQNQHQVGFRVEFGKPYLELPNSRHLARASKSFRSLRWRLGQLQKRRIPWFQGCHRFKKLSSEEDEEEEKKEKIGEVKGFNRIFITYMSEEDEKFYGFGEQFSHMEFKGKRVPIFVQEQGIGRGDQPITLAANLVSYRSGGDSSTTYAPSPFYMTSKMRSLYLEGYSYSVFDLTELDRVQIQIYDGRAQGRILYGSTPVELIERFTETIGRPPELPKWIISGAVVGMQGGTEAVFHVWDHLRKYNVPIAAFWLQDWVGKRKTIIGSQLWWNWEVDTEQYPGWTQLVEDLRSHNIKIMAYCNPCLAPTDDKPNRKRNLFEEANNLGILVKDEAGDTYMVPNTAFDVGMLDFTHPSTRVWFKKILHDMVNSGVRGWMADFGEGLPLDARVFSGEDPISAHNRYPEIWAKINREVVDEWKSMRQSQVREEEDENDDDDSESLVFFMRAGFRESPKWATLFWEGDQMVSWQSHDGIKSAVIGLLSSGLCGYAFNHSDIGGYCAVNLPIIRYQRSEELLLRWMELNAFSTVFRTHEGNNPSANTQFYSNDRALLHFARFAKIYKAWEFYRVQLVKEGAQNGLPVCRHLFIHYPEDEHVHKLTYQQFLVGTEILVVPVLNKGKNEAKAYFPVAGGCSWIHIWTGKCYGKPFDHSSKRKLGFEAWVEAPIGYPAVFVKFDSPIGQTFLRNLRDVGVL